MHYDWEAINRFLTGDSLDTALSAHLCVCADCRRLYERMRDAADIFGGNTALASGLTLSAEQWIYCAALIGGDTFEGMPDVLSRCDAAGRNASYERSRDELISKELLEITFDGTIGIKKRLYDVVDACVNFERFLTLTRRTPGKPERVCGVYEKGGSSIVMYIDGRKGCTAVKRAGKVFFEDLPADNLTKTKDFGNIGEHDAVRFERFSRDDLLGIYDEVKGFGGYEGGSLARDAISLAMSGSSEYFSVAEIIANPGKRGRFRSRTIINTHEFDFEIVYEQTEKSYSMYTV